MCGALTPKVEEESVHRPLLCKRHGLRAAHPPSAFAAHDATAVRARSLPLPSPLARPRGGVRAAHVVREARVAREVRSARARAAHAAPPRTLGAAAHPGAPTRKGPFAAPRGREPRLRKQPVSAGPRGAARRASSASPHLVLPPAPQQAHERLSRSAVPPPPPSPLRRRHSRCRRRRLAGAGAYSSSPHVLSPPSPASATAAAAASQLGPLVDARHSIPSA